MLISVQNLHHLLLHYGERRAARRAAWTKFAISRLGDIFLISALALVFREFGTFDFRELFAAVSADYLTPERSAVLSAIGWFLMLGAVTKSAQFPLHSWLPDTMETPTPVSALMHAGIVNSGGFLINRFAPLYIHTGDVLHWVFIVRLVTAVIGSVLMLSQNDIKKSLGYSTMGQMGFMIMECGVGAFSLAIFHLIAHGLFKGTMFLSAGGIIGTARHDDGVPKDETLRDLGL